MKFPPGNEVYVKSIGRSGHIVVSCDKSTTPIMYLIEFSYPYGRAVFPENDLRGN